MRSNGIQAALTAFGALLLIGTTASQAQEPFYAGKRLTVGRHHPGRNAKTVYSVPHGVLVAVPVGDHDGQPGGHRLDRRKAKGLLDVIRQRYKDIRRCPALAPPGSGPGRRPRSRPCSNVETSTALRNRLAMSQTGTRKPMSPTEAITGRSGVCVMPNGIRSS